MPDIERLLIEVPGIPGKLKSQTLDEYMSALIPEHPARVELATLRSLALDAMKYARTVMDLTAENVELKKTIDILKTDIEMTMTSAKPKPFK